VERSRRIIGAARFQVRTMRVATRITLLIIFAFATLAHAASAAAASHVMVIVQEQQALVQQGSDMLLKVRLSPGVSARIWVDASCGAPNENATIITESGSYVLPIVNMQGRGNSYVCMVSSDQRLSAAVPLFSLMAGGTETVNRRSPQPGR
jgi:hypothetical protein